MNVEQRNDLAKGLLFVLGIPVLLVVVGAVIAVISVWMNFPPGGNLVINEVGEPLAIGESWEQEDLFTVTVDSVGVVGWDSPLLTAEQRETQALQDYQAQGWELYDICFTVSNHRYLGYTDWYRQSKPLVKGLQFWLEVRAYDAQGETLSVVALDKYQRYPEPALQMESTSEDNHCLLAIAPQAAKLDVELMTVREAWDEDRTTDSARPIYQKVYTYDAAEALYDYAAIEELRREGQTVDLNQLAEQMQYAQELPVYAVQYDAAGQCLRIDYQIALQQSGDFYSIDMTKAMQDATVLFAVLADCECVALSWVQPEYGYDCELRIKRSEMLSAIAQQGKPVIDVSDEAADQPYLMSVIEDMIWEPDIMREIYFDHIAELDE